MATPRVQNLSQILAELEPAYAGQRKLFGQQRAQIPGKFAGARTGLEAAKTTGFRDIARGAQSRGLAFSGIPMAEQSQYLAEKYLPGMQNLESQQSSELMQLQMALAELDKDKRLRGVQTRGEQQTALQRWQEAERARAFQAQQAQLDRAQRERLEAANRAAAAAARGGGASDDLANDQRAIGTTLASAVGRDGKVSPTDWRRARADWIARGYPAESFNTRFRHLVNDSHAWDYGFGGSAKRRATSSGSGGRINQLRF